MISVPCPPQRPSELGMFRAILSLLFAVVASATRGEEDLIPFPWLDSSGLATATLVSGAEEPSPQLLSQFHDLTRGAESRVIVVKSGEQPSPAAHDSLPAAILLCDSPGDTPRSRLLDAVSKNRDRVGIRLAPGAAFSIHGRKLDVLSDVPIAVMLATAPGRPLREFELHRGQPYDWTMLRRAALERTHAPFPPLPASPPIVASGSLVIVGGGRIPNEIMQEFIDLAGGPEAPMVVLPIAAGDSLSGDEASDARVLTAAGATNVKSLRARTRAEVESSEFTAALKEAKGVWFNGGRQWRFVDAYMGTKAEQHLRDDLRRGGVIGGTSAGASIQSQYMPRGSPLGNLDMMADGYERGLDFLPGVAIDQHFTQRKRHSDMTALMRRYPQLLGIGIDESTAIVVQESTAQILGRGHVHFYDYRPGPPPGNADYVLGAPGEKYDLAERYLIKTK